MYKKWHAVLTVLVFGLAITVMVVLKAPCSSIPANEEVYPDVGEVIDLIDEYDLVVFETYDGNQWVFSGIEDWFVGDQIAIVFNDSGTSEDRSDDWIMSVRYFA